MILQGLKTNVGAVRHEVAQLAELKSPADWVRQARAALYASVARRVRARVERTRRQQIVLSTGYH